MNENLQKLLHEWLPDMSETENVLFDKLRLSFSSPQIIAGLEISIATTQNKFIKYKIAYLRKVILSNSHRHKKISKPLSYFPDPFCPLCEGTGGQVVSPPEQQGYIYKFWKPCSCLHLQSFQAYDDLLKLRSDELKKIENLPNPL